MTAIRKALVLALFIVASSASWVQKPSDDDPPCGEPGIGKLQLTKEDTTILGLTIGSASLENVKARLGKTGSLPIGGSASASTTICYVSPTDGTVLTFGSSDLGGHVDVTEFALWSREAKFPNVSACKPSKLVSRSISTSSGIKLGLSAQQLTDIVGTKPKTRPVSVHYELICRRKMTPDEIKGFKTGVNWDITANPYIDVSSFVDARFSSSGTSHIAITKVESY
jgi:hypothetical protein